MSLLDSLLEGLSEALELPDPINETGEISEADEMRKNNVAEIMGDVFTEDVVESWDNLPDEAKVDLLNEYYQRMGEELDIHVTQVHVEDLQAQYGEGIMGYNNGDGSVHVDISCLDSVEQLPDLLDTITHEARHQLQNEAVADPSRFPDIPKEVLDQWQYELDHYISPEYDFEGYYNQAIERDARDFGESVLDQYTESLISQDVVTSEEAYAFRL